MSETGSLRDDPRPTDELIRLALATEDEDTRWRSIGVLQLRDDDKVLDQIWPLCESDNAAERALCMEILGHSEAAKRVAPERTAALIRRFLEQERDADVLSHAASAAEFRDDPDLLAALLKLKQHPVEDVRFGVVLGLTGRTDNDSITALIELSQDEDTHVRDWATFGLGTQSDEADSNEIRAALIARLTDEDEDTRCEAMRGLAMRGDQRVVEPILRELDFQGDDISKIVFEAAVEAGKRIADPRLYEQLRKLLDYASYDLETEDIQEAMRYQQQQPGFPGEE